MSGCENKMFEKLLGAINENNINAVKSILKLPKFNLNMTVGSRFSLLHIAVWGGKTEISKLLIEAGCDVNAREAVCGKTPIFNALSCETVKDLIDAGADVNAQDLYDNNTALHGLISNNSIVKLILDSGFNVHIKNRMGWNVLHYHTASGHHWLIDDLLKSGLDIDDETDDGKSVMDIAKYYKIDECIAVLERSKLKKIINTENQKYVGVGL